jgi:hypothetical protein
MRLARLMEPMVRYLRFLSEPGVVGLALLLAIVSGGFFGYHHVTTSTLESGEVTNSMDVSGESSIRGATEVNEADYLAEVSSVQKGAVDVFASSNDKLLRYDALTRENVADLQANYSALGDYDAQIENVIPPEEYKDQYRLLSVAVDDLYRATEIAYRSASNPVSANRSGFEEYEHRVDEATDYLNQSNKILGQNFKTTEGLQLPMRLT